MITFANRRTLFDQQLSGDAAGERAEVPVSIGNGNNYWEYQGSIPSPFDRA